MIRSMMSISVLAFAGQAASAQLAPAGPQQIRASADGEAIATPVQARATVRFRDAAHDDVLPAIGHPPLHTIPPMPMPEALPGQLTPDIPMGVPVTHDGATGQTFQGLLYQPSGLEGASEGGYTALMGEYHDEQLASRGFGTMSQITGVAADPWRRNVKIVMRFVDSGGTNRFFVCSGTMADPETVLTAGHCVYARTPNGLTINSFAAEFWVYPGWDGNGVTADQAQIIQTHGIGHGTVAGAFTGWTQDGNFNWDMGLIRLNRAVGHLTGWFGWAFGGDCATIMGRNYNLASYPAEGCGIAGLHNGQDMYYWLGGYDNCTNGNQQLFFNTNPGCFTAQWGGMSGGGSYYFTDNDVRVVHAVVSNSNNSTFANHTRMWESFKDFMLDFENDSRGSALDLQMLRARYLESSVTAGQPITGDGYVVPNPTNNNPGSATYSVTHYLSTNANISTGDTPIGSETYNADYAPVQNFNINNAGVSYNIPLDTPSGTYYAGAILNTSDANTGNNDGDQWDAQEITVNGVADISARTVTHPGGTRFLGENVTVNYSFENLGGDSSNTVDVEIRLSTNTTISTFDTLLWSGSFAGLSGGQVVSDSVSVTLPNSGTGTHYIGVIVDASDDVDGSNDTLASSSINIEGRADLFANSITAGVSTVSPGASMPVQHSVRNLGLGNSGAYTVQVRASTNTTITGSDTLLGTFNHPSLAPGGIHAQTWNVTVPLSLAEGDYYIGMIVSNGNFENQTSNNTDFDSSQVSVAGCIADLEAPFGVLNFNDVIAYLSAFGAGEREADLAEPFGILNFNDVIAYLTAFAAGCP